MTKEKEKTLRSNSLNIYKTYEFKVWNTMITALEQRRDKTIAIKQGMMQQLLTGNVRLVMSEISKGWKNEN